MITKIRKNWKVLSLRRKLKKMKNNNLKIITITVAIIIAMRHHNK